MRSASVLARCTSTEAFDHRGRRIDLLQLHLGDLDAGLVAVEDLLRLMLHVGLDLRAHSVSAGWIGVRPITSRIELSATAFTMIVRVAGVEQVVDGVVDPPEHREIDVDDVLVAGQHQAFLRHVAAGLVSPLVDLVRAAPSGSRSRCG